MITKFRLGICLDFVSHPDLPKRGYTLYFVSLSGIDDLILAGFFFFLITFINVTVFSDHMQSLTRTAVIFAVMAFLHSS